MSEIAHSKTEVINDEILIPTSLRPVAPFLDEAQAILTQDSASERRSKVGIYCIDHAFELLDQYNLPLDDDAKLALKRFKEKRDQVASQLVSNLEGKHATENLDLASITHTNSDGVKLPPEQVLLMEAKHTLELADEQLHENLTKEAAQNFHTATVYFRVLENLVPSLTTEVHSLLHYAATRTRQCSHLIENFVHEHFEGKRFSEFYNIDDKKRLGKGSYGSVYLCTHKRTKDAFACKVISMNRISSHYLRKLHVEIAIMKEVDHPNIVKLREVFFGSRTVYLVMDLCSGGELFEELTHFHKRGFDEPHAAKIMIDMISAVSYLHHHGIVHRDLKLENFLFEEKSIDSDLKLIDFGLSKHFHEHEAMHQIVGSAYYTAPEVLNGTYDHRCDVWSLGVIAYMMLSGSPPFHGDSSDAIHEMILHAEASFPDKRFGNRSPIAVDFIKQILQKDPEKRISLDEALKHDFLKLADNIELADGSHHLIEASDDVVQSLNSFMEMSKFKQMVMGAVAFTLSPAQIHDLREEFHAIDTDHSGTISMSELKESMSKVSGDSKEHIVEHLHELGYADDVEIHYHEFVAAAMCKRISIDEERLHVAFENLDVDGSGYLDYEGIKHAVGDGISDEDIHEMLNQIDEDGDGKIDYKEFMHFWKRTMVSDKVKASQMTSRLANTAEKINKSINMLQANKR